MNLVVEQANDVEARVASLVELQFFVGAHRHAVVRFANGRSAPTFLNAESNPLVKRSLV